MANTSLAVRAPGLGGMIGPAVTTPVRDIGCCGTAPAISGWVVDLHILKFPSAEIKGLIRPQVLQRPLRSLGNPSNPIGLPFVALWR